MESQRQRGTEAEQGFELGTGAPRHELMTTEPRCLCLLSSRLSCLLAVSLGLSYGVPAGLWDRENETLLTNTGHGLLSCRSLCAKNKMPFSLGGSAPCQGTWDSSPLSRWLLTRSEMKAARPSAGSPAHRCFSMRWWVLVVQSKGSGFGQL